MKCSCDSIGITLLQLVEDRWMQLAGELLVDNLLKLIEGETVESLLLPGHLVVRKSCGEKD